MTLVDTSVWIDFFRGDQRAGDLAVALEENGVLMHPWVLGELALGSLGRKRRAILADLQEIPVATVVDDSDVLAMVEAHGIAGKGIGWVDCHLLASARVEGVPLWTHDRKLQHVLRGMPAE